MTKLALLTALSTFVLIAACRASRTFTAAAITGVVLTGCPSGDNFDWSKRPYQDIVPPPVGRWAEPVNLYVDLSTVYGSDGREVPAWIHPRVLAPVREVLKVQQEFSGEHANGFAIVSDPAKANTTLRLYYGPYQSKTTSAAQSLLTDWGNTLPPPFITEEGASKSASAALVPPSASKNWNGVVYLTRGKSGLKHGDCWINVFALEWFVNEGERVAPRPYDADAFFRGWAETVMFHEWGHWGVGLADGDNPVLFYRMPDGTRIPGMMYYYLMTNRPCEQEQATIDFMYPKEAK